MHKKITCQRMEKMTIRTSQKKQQTLHYRSLQYSMPAPFSEDFQRPQTLLEGRSLRTKPIASSKDMCVGWPFRDSASTMKRSMPAAAASSKKVIVSGGTAEMSEMYTSNSPELTLPCSVFHRLKCHEISYTNIYIYICMCIVIIHIIFGISSLFLCDVAPFTGTLVLSLFTVKTLVECNSFSWGLS